MADVVIDDDFFVSSGMILQKRADFDNKILNQFISCLKTVQETGLIEGQTAEAFRTFTETVEKCKGLVYDEGLYLKTATAALVQEVDLQDGNLYEE